MKRTEPTAADRAPFMLMGILCWLCGAVVIGVATQLLFGWIEAVIAAAVVTAIVLALFWSLSSAASPKS